MSSEHDLRTNNSSSTSPNSRSTTPLKHSTEDREDSTIHTILNGSTEQDLDAIVDGEHSEHHIPSPSNVIIVHGLESSEDERSLLFKHLSLIDVIFIRVIPSNVSRGNSAIIILNDRDDAMEVKNRFELAQIASKENYQITFGKEVFIDVGLLNMLRDYYSKIDLGLSVGLQGFLTLPPDNRQWLISPPASPPVGWKPRPEDVFTSNPCPDLSPVPISDNQSLLFAGNNNLPQIIVTSY